MWRTSNSWRDRKMHDHWNCYRTVEPIDYYMNDHFLRIGKKQLIILTSHSIAWIFVTKSHSTKTTKGQALNVLSICLNVLKILNLISLLMFSYRAHTHTRENATIMIIIIIVIWLFLLSRSPTLIWKDQTSPMSNNKFNGIYLGKQKKKNSSPSFIYLWFGFRASRLAHHNHKHFELNSITVSHFVLSLPGSFYCICSHFLFPTFFFSS